ncbi:MAG: cupin domain-containing protein [Gemmatimonadota bacterium]
MRSPVAIAALFLSTACLASAQAPAPVTLITASEIAAAVAHNSDPGLADTVLRVVPVQGQYNLGVAVVRRSKVDGRTLADATVHDAIAEVYQIIEGRGVLVTGGTLDSAVAFPPDGPIVRQKIGPSSYGKHIVGGVPHEVGPGDVVIIPPHVVHGFRDITTERIVYLLIRYDPGQLLQTTPPAP